MTFGAALSGIGSIIGGAAPILGGLLGGKEDNYHPEVWRNDRTKDYMQQIRTIKAAAEEYGFHPLALLGANVGSGGFAQPVGGGSSNFLGDSLAGVANIFGDVGSLYESDQDRRERAEERVYQRDQDAKNRLERNLDRVRQDAAERRSQQMTDAQLRNIEADTMLKEAQSRTEAGQLRNLMMGAVGSGVSSQPMVDPLYMPDGSLLLSGGGSDAQDWENRYGSVAAEFVGLGNFFRDQWNKTMADWGAKFSLPSGGPLRRSPSRVVN